MTIFDAISVVMVEAEAAVMTWLVWCIRAFAAVVDRPVAAANADLGPAKGISGDPRAKMGFAIVMISGMSFSIN